MTDEEKLELYCEAYRALHRNVVDGAPFKKLLERLGLDEQHFQKLKESGAFSLNNALLE